MKKSRLSHKVAWKRVIGRLKNKLIWISDLSTHYKSDKGTFTSMPNTQKGFKLPAGGKALRDSGLKCRCTFKGSCRAFPRLSSKFEYLNARVLRCHHDGVGVTPVQGGRGMEKGTRVEFFRIDYLAYHYLSM